jgi:hypothetical protein
VATLLLLLLLRTEGLLAAAVTGIVCLLFKSGIRASFSASPNFEPAENTAGRPVRLALLAVDSRGRSFSAPAGTRLVFSLRMLPEALLLDTGLSA